MRALLALWHYDSIKTKKGKVWKDIHKCNFLFLLNWTPLLTFCLLKQHNESSSILGRMYESLITANEEEIYCQSPPPNSQHRPLCWFLKCFLSYFSSSKRDSAFTPSLRFTLFSKAVWLFQPQGVLSFLKSKTQHPLMLQLAWVSNRFVGDLPVRATVIMCASRSTLEQ